MFRFALSLRFLMLLASVGAVFGALLMFWVGGAKLLGALTALLDDREETVTTASVVMAATDSFLFGIVLMIFAYAITFGFVYDLAEEERRRVPAWMRIEGINELKQTLVQVIIVYLVVDFATDIAEPGTHHHSWQILVLPVSILLLAGALRLMSVVPHVSVGDQCGKL
jgi:uncharacterized membrane protein YqhA